MGFNWITFCAQIVNLFILVWLLKRFLYKPVLSAVEKRQQYIAEKIENARLAVKSAQDEQKALQSERKALETQKETLLKQAVLDAAAEKESALTKLSEETKLLRQKAQNDLNRQVEASSAFARDFMIQSFLNLSDQMLKQICNTDINKRALDVFVEQVSTSSDDVKKQIKTALKKGNPLILTTAFSLSDSEKTTISAQLKKILKITSIPVEFKVDDTLIAGVELNISDIQISWHLKSYVETFETQLKNQLSTLIIK